MRSNTKLYAVALIFLVAAFAYGAVRLILMRYESGEVYPPYSTYRSDPLGAKVFYESLDALPGRIVTRNLDPLNTVAGNRAITLYINGLSIESYGPESLSGALARDIDRVLRHGGRVVLSFAPLAYDYDKELAEIEAFEERMDRRFNRDKIDDRDQPPRPEEPPPPPVVDDELPAESEKEDETVLSEPPTDQDESDDEEDR